MTKISGIRGRDLNRLWNVNARHALYREDGKWYHQLQYFPGALFDANGYIIFNTKTEYNKSPFLQIKQYLHVPRGISAIPGYIRISEGNNLLPLSQRLNEIAESPSDYIEKFPSNSDDNIPNVPEGRRTVERIHYESERIIRDTQVGRWVKQIHRHHCQICGHVIVLQSNTLYAEAHHIKPLGGGHNGPDVAENILCVCPNHHVLLDYGVIQIDLSQIKCVEGHEISNEYIDYHNKICYKGN